MKIYTFKTNINCNGCVAQVTPYLNALNEIKWEVDTNMKEKILKVESDDVDRDEIMNIVRNAGFTIEPLS